MMVTLLGSNVPLLLDEGSEVNAMDGDFAKEKNIRLAPSSRSASGAGNQSLDILGETALDLYVKTEFPHGRKVAINMGKVTVIKNLGVPLILGEPGKGNNNIKTDATSRSISLEKQGEIMTKPYLENSDTEVHICRIKVRSVTIFPEDKITFEIRVSDSILLQCKQEKCASQATARLSNRR